MLGLNVQSRSGRTWLNVRGFFFSYTIHYKGCRSKWSVKLHCKDDQEGNYNDCTKKGARSLFSLQVSRGGKRRFRALLFFPHSFTKKIRGQEKDATKQNSSMRQTQIGLSQPAPIASTARSAYHAGVSLCFLLFYVISLCYLEMMHHLCRSN